MEIRTGGRRLTEVYFALPLECIALPPTVRERIVRSDAWSSPGEAPSSHSDQLRRFVRRSRAFLRQIESQRSLQHYAVFVWLSGRMQPLLLLQAILALALNWFMLYPEHDTHHRQLSPISVLANTSLARFDAFDFYSREYNSSEAFYDSSNSEGVSMARLLGIIHVVLSFAIATVCVLLEDQCLGGMRPDRLVVCAPPRSQALDPTRARLHSSFPLPCRSIACDSARSSSRRERPPRESTRRRALRMSGSRDRHSLHCSSDRACRFDCGSRRSTLPRASRGGGRSFARR